ncbi:MAG TPA: hypothetical protein VN285_08530 [Candidatus Deferrimicrobium sp.]|nr:hypothetical protein [Candidatus Deferrimicrobium sp.]
MKDSLYDICVRHIVPKELEVVIHEPYVPYVPDPWSQILVLAEAQNLSSASSADYVKTLRSMTSTERILRLGRGGCVGVYPWDDGSLKLAIESALGVKTEAVAVSNAVFWSQEDEAGNNVNPSSVLQERSTALWSELLPILAPNHIVTCGQIAHNVIDQVPSTAWRGKRTKLRLPSRTAMSRVSSMFDEADLLRRYPEVSAVVQVHPDWVEGAYRHNKIFFACHAVSVAKRADN